MKINHNRNSFNFAAHAKVNNFKLWRSWLWTALPIFVLFRLSVKKKHIITVKILQFNKKKY